MNKEKRYVDLDEVIKTILSLIYLDDGCDLLSYEVIHAIEDLPTICDVMNDLRLDIDGYRMSSMNMQDIACVAEQKNR